jgi:beta-lactamase regulating signal transducer with metallopeptidase domain
MLESSGAVAVGLEAAPAAHAPATLAALDWPSIVASLLLLGTVLGSGRLLAGLLRLRALHRRARLLDSPPWLLALREELAPRARFVTSPDVLSPATFGLRRPIVVLPTVFAALAPEQQRAVAVHELLHARRGDWLPLVVEELARAILFFHPTVHWLVGRIRLAREQVVDAEAVDWLGLRDAYLDSLLAAGRLAARSRAVPAAPFLGESHLRERVELLLKEVSMSRPRTLIHLALSAFGLLLVTAWVVAAAPLHSAPETPASPAALASAPEEPAGPAQHEPKVLDKVRPAYPPDAKAEGVQGVFLIDVVISRDGAVRDPHTIASAPSVERLEQIKSLKGTDAALEGDPRLEKAAVDAVRQWRFEPVVRDGAPVEAKMTVVINFRLH